MFSFIKQYAETMMGIDIYPKVSLVMFFLFFSLILWYSLRSKNEYFRELEQIPFDKNDSE